MADLLTLIAEPSDAYSLLDSGGRRKLERYGPHRLIRPEPQAMWEPAEREWRADGEFIGGSDEEGGGRWTLAPALPRGWPLAYGPVRFHAGPTPFRHLGFFPDMRPQWDWMQAQVRPGDEVMNLFGYTGVASLLLAAAGARVTHVDASRKSVEAARANAALSGLEAAPIRWLVDDAPKFVAREGRRGRRYRGIVLDPPKYGRGPGGEVWQLETGLAPLVRACAAILESDGWLVLTTYAVRLSAHALGNLIAAELPSGRLEAGEMTVREEARGLLLPTAIFARWSNRALVDRSSLGAGPVAQG